MFICTLRIQLFVLILRKTVFQLSHFHGSTVVPVHMQLCEYSDDCNPKAVRTNSPPFLSLLCKTAVMSTNNGTFLNRKMQNLEKGLISENPTRIYGLHAPYQIQNTFIFGIILKYECPCKGSARLHSVHLFLASSAAISSSP